MKRLSAIRASFSIVLLASGPLALAAPPSASSGSFVLDGPDESGTAMVAAAAAQTPRARPMAFEYSDGYNTRLKIHKWASYATLPLFAAQTVVGQKLYNGTGSDGTRSLHKDLVGVTAVLFGVNSVTGVWNMLEARKDPNHKTKRTVHGVLMLVADAGFLATGLTAPHRGRINAAGFFDDGGGTSQSTHRALAISSMGVATVAYLMMLLH
jgi:hypothetical protein